MHSPLRVLYEIVPSFSVPLELSAEKYKPVKNLSLHWLKIEKFSINVNKSISITIIQQTNDKLIFVYFFDKENYKMFIAKIWLNDYILKWENENYIFIFNSKKIWLCQMNFFIYFFALQY